MSKEKPDWEKLEIICAEIQKQIDPNAVVRHNHWVKGTKTCRRRKLDISISQTVSSCPIFIIIDCKRHKKAVKMKDVYAFAGQIEDVNAHLGIMISTSGFDAGAVAVAKEKNILLRTYRTPTDGDWKKILGEKSWMFITMSNLVMYEVYIETINLETQILPDTVVLNSKGERLGTVYEHFLNAWKSGSLFNFVGDFEMELKAISEPFFIKLNDSSDLIETERFRANLKSTATKYAVNLTLANGNIIEDFQTGKIVYKKIISEGINWKELVKNQKGIQLTQDEYNEDKKGKTVSADLTNARSWIRLVITNNKPQ